MTDSCYTNHSGITVMRIRRNIAQPLRGTGSVVSRPTALGACHGIILPNKPPASTATCRRHRQSRKARSRSSIQRYEERDQRTRTTNQRLANSVYPEDHNKRIDSSDSCESVYTSSSDTHTASRAD